MAGSTKYLLLVAIALLVLLPSGAHAFGAGNIASISKIEGKNWRHGEAYPAFISRLSQLTLQATSRICSQPLPACAATNGNPR
jgi:hypothetical protein